MYGKVMSVPDGAMPAFFRLVTRWQPAEVAARLAEIESGAIHPMDAKMALAREIVAIYHGEAAVAPAEGHFKRVYQEGGTPERLPILAWSKGRTLLDLVASAGAVRSRSEARRLIEQRAVKVDSSTWDDPSATTDDADGKTIQIGKGRFFRIQLSDG
jgi:tyrosyl-tRNA synthetase